MVELELPARHDWAVQEKNYGKLVIEPFEPGFALTVGIAYRRALLSAIHGAAPTWVKIENVLHEFSHLPGVTEDTLDIMLNLRKVVFALHVNRPKILRLRAQGTGVVKASDFEKDADVEILTPDVPLATLDKDGVLEMEVCVERGRGYVSAEKREPEALPINAILLDADFSPVKRVNFHVEAVATGRERLVLEVWTDGSVAPTAAVGEASRILEDHFALLTAFPEATPEEEAAERDETRPRTELNENPRSKAFGLTRADGSRYPLDGSILVPIWIHHDGDADGQERPRATGPPSQGAGDPAPAEPQPRGHRVPRGARPGGSGGRRSPARARARGASHAGGWASHRSGAGATQDRRACVIVVDTNLLVYLYVSGQRTAQADTVLVRDPVWVAPLLWRSEFRNVLACLVHRRGLGLDDAVRIAHEAERRMAGGEYTVASQQVLGLAVRSGCSAYDCEFVGLARDLRVSFVTGDRQIFVAFPFMAISFTVFIARWR